MNIIKTLLVLILIGGLNQVSAQTPDQKISVQVFVEVNENWPVITLRWTPVDGATQYLIHRKYPSETNWGPVLAVLDADAIVFHDSTVVFEQEYNYRVVRQASTIGFGYTRSGIGVVPASTMGHILVIVDTVSISADNFYIEQYLVDLIKEGWHPVLMPVDRSDLVSDVKSRIVDYRNQNVKLRSLSLVGHVPVPYSGEIAPDGHGNHVGAWPADGFYGDMNGSWTDVTVNNTTSSGVRNDNIPGDLKYDQNTFPSDLELEVGRIDLSNLPEFSESELELTEKYFKKNHAFRTKEFTPLYRGLIENNFGSFEEGFGQNGLKNFTAMFGPEKTSYVDFDTLKNHSYIWAYGCGGGSFTSASGIGNTASFAADSLQAVFVTIFGSYFGDYDISNNFLRSALGTGSILTNAWAGRPNWYFYPMALGHTTGYCAKLTQNNSGGQHSSGFGNRSVHIALMGDPTLRMYVSSPPTSIQMEETDEGILISWENMDNNAEKYFVLRSIEGGPYEAISYAVDEKHYLDTDASCLNSGMETKYMVRNLEKMITSSGVYYNPSPGIEGSILVQNEYEMHAEFIYYKTGFGDAIQFENMSIPANSWHWDFGDGHFSTGAHPQHTYQESGQYLVRLKVESSCDTAMYSYMINVKNTPPNSNIYNGPIQITTNLSQGFVIVDGDNNKFQVEITDIQGKVIKFLNSRSTRMNIDVSDLPKGNYTLKVIQAGGDSASVILKI